MLPVYRSPVPRCWEVNHTGLPVQHFFAFELVANVQGMEYGTISEFPGQMITVEYQDIEFDLDATHAQKRLLPRSICRLILTGKPLVESVVGLQKKRKEVCSKWVSILESGTADPAYVDDNLERELWSIDDYLAQLHNKISRLYHHVTYESKLIHFDSETNNDSCLEKADLRAEHVEQLLDTFEKGKWEDCSRKWRLPFSRRR